VSNSFEGTIFVPASLDDLYDAGQFAGQAWPKTTPDEQTAILSTYANTGTNIEQMRFVFGEGKLPLLALADRALKLPKLSALLMTAIFVCTTYRLMSAFEGNAYKVIYNS
jgi:hypothetical protein